MMTCQFCNTSMVRVTSFSKNKRENFSRCPVWKRESEHQRDNFLIFGELLSREIGGGRNGRKNKYNS